MAHLLKNKNLELQVDLPREHYNLSRFDWTGKIISVKYKDKFLSGSELADLNKNPFCGKGFYNEFGINAPIGYDEIEIGDWFHKIGVGLLKKEESEYQFHKRYNIQPAAFQVDLEANKIRMKCQSKFQNGYSYQLEKEVELLNSGFEIKYHLENNGVKEIVTNEYNHNFISIDKKWIGKDYVLKFPFQIQPDQLEESVNPEGIVILDKNEVRFQSTPVNPFFFSNLSGGASVEAKWKLENLRSKIGISESGSFRTSSINLWGWGHVISPELFIHLHILPGQSKQWTRTYHIYEMD